MRNKDFRKKHSGVINRGKEAYKLFVIITGIVILFYLLWIAYDNVNFDLFASVIGAYIIFILGFILSTIGEFVYSFKIKNNIPREIRSDYIKNVMYRSIVWVLIVGFAFLCSYILIPIL